MHEMAIPRDEAREICDRIRNERAHLMLSQCWDCICYSRGDFSMMCVSSKPGFRGCALVNNVFDRKSG